jgi:hypothetical protein
MNGSGTDLLAYLGLTCLGLGLGLACYGVVVRERLCVREREK